MASILYRSADLDFETLHVLPPAQAILRNQFQPIRNKNGGVFVKMKFLSAAASSL
jgi:hypothetical protein